MASIKCKDNVDIKYYHGWKSSDKNVQSQGVISRFNVAYFCEVQALTITTDDEDTTLVTAIKVDFNARCDCSLGPSPNPHEAKLYVQHIEYSPKELFITSKLFYQVVGSVTFSIPKVAGVTLSVLSSSNLKFRYAVKYSKVFLLTPQCDERRCPHCSQHTMGIDGNEYEIYDCSNCHLTKEGQHWRCENETCDLNYCFECLSASYVDTGCGVCKIASPLHRIENGELSKPGWIRHCDNCASLISMDDSQLSSFYKHCSNCNFNLCRACAFHPNRTYNTCTIDETLHERFDLKLRGHKDDILSFYISTDGISESCHMITTSKDKTAVIWDMKTGWLMKRLSGHLDWVRSGLIVYHHEEDDDSSTRIPYAVTVSDDRTAFVWNILDEIAIEPIVIFREHSDNIYAVGTFDKLTIPASSLLKSRLVRNAIITAGADGVAYVWEILTGIELEMFRIEIGEPIYSLVIIPSNIQGVPRVILGTPTRAVLYLMDNPKNPYQEFNSFGLSLEYLKIFTNENGELMLLGCDRSTSVTSMVWNVNTGLKKYNLTSPSKLSSVNIYHNDIIGGCFEGEITVWGKDKKLDKKNYAPNQVGEVTAVAVYDYFTNVNNMIYYPILVTAVSSRDRSYVHLFRYDRIGRDFEQITTVKDISTDIPCNVFNQGVIKTIICTLDRDRKKKVIGIHTINFSGIPVVIIATAKKICLLDFYNGAVMKEHLFTHLVCTAIAIIQDEYAPKVVFGGRMGQITSESVEMLRYDRDISDVSDNHHMVGIWNMRTGKREKFMYWESSIESMVASFNEAGNPIVVTSGYASFHANERRIIHWDCNADIRRIVHTTQNVVDSLKNDQDRKGNISEFQNSVLSLHQVDNEDYLVEISKAGIGHNTLRLMKYQLSSMTVKKLAIIEEQSGIWTTFRLSDNTGDKLVVLQSKPAAEASLKRASLKQKATETPSSKITVNDTTEADWNFSSTDRLNELTYNPMRQKPRQQKILVVDLNCDQRDMRSRSNTYSVGMTDTNENCYLMSACGQKELEYIALVHSIEKTRQSVRITGHSSIPTRPGSGKFGVSADKYRQTSIDDSTIIKRLLENNSPEKSPKQKHFEKRQNNENASVTQKASNDLANDFSEKLVKSLNDFNSLKHISFVEKSNDKSNAADDLHIPTVPRHSEDEKDGLQMPRLSYSRQSGTPTTSQYNISYYQSGRSRIVVYDVRSKKLHYELIIPSKVTSLTLVKPTGSLQKEPLALIACEDGIFYTWNIIRKVEIDGYEWNVKRFREGIKEKNNIDDYWLNKMIAAALSRLANGLGSNSHNDSAKLMRYPFRQDSNDSTVDKDTELLAAIGESGQITRQHGLKYFDTKYWIQNQKIIYEAIDKKIESYINEMTLYVGDSAYIFSRGLDIAIKSKNPRIVKMILNYWLILLNKEVSNKVVGADWFHRPSEYLQKDTLLQLAYDSSDAFMKEFANFICGIQLVKAPEDIKGIDESWSIEGDEVITGSSHIYSEAINVWRDKLQQSSRQSLEAYFIPLRDAASLDMLQAYVNVCNELDDLRIFKSPIGIYVTKYVWHEFGLRTHILEMIKYIIFLVLFTLTTAMYSTWNRNPLFEYQIAYWILEVIIVLYLLWYVYDEYQQIPFTTTNDETIQAAIRDSIANYQPETIIFSLKIRIIRDVSRQSWFYYPSLLIKSIWNTFWMIILSLLLPIDYLIGYLTIVIYFSMEYIFDYLQLKSKRKLFHSSLIRTDLFALIIGYNLTIGKIHQVLLVYLPLVTLKFLWNTFLYIHAGFIIVIFKIFFFEYLTIQNIGILMNYYLNHFWNFIDFMIISMGFLGLGLRFFSSHDNLHNLYESYMSQLNNTNDDMVTSNEEYISSRNILAIASLATWFKLLYFMIPFEITGRLVSTILEMAYEIRFFIVIIIIVVFGFTQAFWLLNYSQRNITITNIFYTLLDTYYLIIGEYPSIDTINASDISKMYYFLQILFTLTITILMLNLLIALMSDAYGKIRDNGEAQWRYDQAVIILEELRVNYSSRTNHSKFTPKPYIHILKSSEAVEQDVNPFDPSNTNHRFKFNPKSKINEMELKLSRIEKKLELLLSKNTESWSELNPRYDPNHSLYRKPIQQSLQEIEKQLDQSEDEYDYDIMNRTKKNNHDEQSNVDDHDDDDVDSISQIHQRMT